MSLDGRDGGGAAPLRNPPETPERPAAGEIKGTLPPAVGSLRVGDEVRCTDCGAVAIARTTVPATWSDGDPILLSWSNGPFLRHQAVPGAAAVEKHRCCWCEERALGFRSVMGRPFIDEAPWIISGTLRTYEVPPLSRARPSITAEPIPGVDSIAERRSASERFEELAEAFRRETGLLAPGKDQPAAMGGSPSDEERQTSWLAWCRQRATAAAPKRETKPKPETQGTLF